VPRLLLTRGKRSNSTNTFSALLFLLTTLFKPRNSSITVGFCSLLFSLNLWVFFSVFFLMIEKRPVVLSDDVPLVVSRQLLQTFAHELGRLEPETQKEIAHYTLAQIQPRVVSFEEQVRFYIVQLFCEVDFFFCNVAVLWNLDFYATVSLFFLFELSGFLMLIITDSTFFN